jgi:hypothetical protein
MAKRTVKILLAAAAAIIGWLTLYGILVGPAWSNAEESQAKAAALQKKCAVWHAPDAQKPHLRPLPEAKTELHKNNEALKRELLVSAHTFFANKANLHRLRDYTRKAIGEGDPNNYFDRLRRKTAEQIVRQYVLTLDPNWTDLGFRGAIVEGEESESKVELNLLRLAMLERLAAAVFQAADKQPGLFAITRIGYGPTVVAPFPDEENEKAAKKETDADWRNWAQPEQPKAAPPPFERIFEAPMRVWLRAPERNFVRLLFELQRAPQNPDEWGFLTVRSFRIETNEKYRAEGVVECSVSVCALLPESVYLGEFRIPHKDKQRSFLELPGMNFDDGAPPPLPGMRE